MQKQAPAGSPPSAGRARQEPLAEGIRKRPRGFFARMGDDDLAAYAREIVKIKGIGTQTELRSADSGLYGTLCRRRLMDGVFGGSGRVAWRHMDDGELVDHTKAFMEDMGLSTRRDLEKANRGLYLALMRRGLLDSVGFARMRRQHRKWKSAKDEEVLRFAEALMGETGIRKREELRQADGGLYFILRMRGLLDTVGFDDREMAGIASDSELLDHARTFIERNGIRGRRQLSRCNAALYERLRLRGLLDEAGLQSRRMTRDWRSMDDDRLIAFAKEFIAQEGISSRESLNRIDPGLRAALFRRELLDDVFSDIEKSKDARALQEVVAALEEF